MGSEAPRTALGREKFAHAAPRLVCFGRKARCVELEGLHAASIAGWALAQDGQAHGEAATPVAGL